jgi:hypothetical protein
MEADDDRAGRLGQQDVALGDRADAALDDVDDDLLVRQLTERVGERLGRTTLVGLDEQLERALVARRRHVHEVLERDRALRRAARPRLTVQPLATLRDVARLRRVLDHDQLVARHRDAGQTEDLHRIAGPADFTILPRSSSSARTRPENCRR